MKPSEKYFEEAWKAYPMKVGKKAARRHYNASVDCEEMHYSLIRAMDKYIAFVNSGERPWQNGSTWFNNWEDWKDFEPPPKIEKKTNFQENMDKIKSWGKKLIQRETDENRKLSKGDGGL